jgi:hypothetical protein
MDFHFGRVPLFSYTHPTCAQSVGSTALWHGANGSGYFRASVGRVSLVSFVELDRCPRGLEFRPIASWDRLRTVSCGSEHNAGRNRLKTRGKSPETL